MSRKWRPFRPDLCWCRKISNIRRTLVGNTIVNHSDVVLDLTSGFKGFDKDSRKTVRGSFKCSDLVRLILETRRYIEGRWATVHPKKYAHGFCFAVLCCGYTLTDFPISIRLTSLALWQSNDCPSASKATLMNMDKYFMWIHYERLHNHNKAKHNKTVCIFLGIYCMYASVNSAITGTGNDLSP